jgi:Protein of unknown function (DUF2568)
MLTILRRFNLTLRVIMETGIVIGLGYWGFQAGNSTGIKIILGIGAPVIIFGFWSLVDFRNAGKSAEPLRLCQELIIAGIAAVAFFYAGQPAFGWILGIISIVHHILVYMIGDTLLK